MEMQRVSAHGVLLAHVVKLHTRYATASHNEHVSAEFGSRWRLPLASVCAKRQKKRQKNEDIRTGLWQKNEKIIAKLKIQIKNTNNMKQAHTEFVKKASKKTSLPKEYLLAKNYNSNNSKKQTKKKTQTSTPRSCNKNFIT